MEINTLRLSIFPLNVIQFAHLLEGTDKMEADLGLSKSGAAMDKDTAEAMKELYEEALSHEGLYFWYTNWPIVLKIKNLCIGSFCFKGSPDETGAVEIGYGINEAFRRLGYMTEAVEGITEWALSRPEVCSVTAETEKWNTASQKVLMKCGFVKYSETEETFFWRRDV